MKILVINCGSSSLKYQFFDMQTETVIFSGGVERIGEEQSRITHRWLDKQQQNRQVSRDETISDHRAAFESVIRTIGEAKEPDALDAVDAIGHRVVHGGESFQAPGLIDDSAIESIRRVCPLAPLHNPANLTGIEICMALFPDTPQVAVFDTAFHQTMPPHAYRYPLPVAWYEDSGVRRYGFHGTSHAYVAQQAADFLQQPLESLNIISLHLGNGASAAAIAQGKCIDTSMGMTPLEGLMMGTRSGDIDPAIVFYMSRQGEIPIEEVEAILNSGSGLKGVAGVNDMRETQNLASAGDAGAQLAIDLYCYRIKKYVGAYCAALGRVDALVFTAGVGENSAEIRSKSLAMLGQLGIEIDEQLNAQAGRAARAVQSAASSVKILVIPTDEELSIARQTLTCISN